MGGAARPALPRRRALSAREGGAGAGSGGEHGRGAGPRSERPGCGAGRWRHRRRRHQPGRQALGGACGGAASGCSTGCRCSSSPASSAGPTTPMSPSSACVSAAAAGGGRDGLPRDGAGSSRAPTARSCRDGAGGAGGGGGGVCCLSALGPPLAAAPAGRGCDTAWRPAGLGGLEPGGANPTSSLAPTPGTAGVALGLRAALFLPPPGHACFPLPCEEGADRTKLVCHECFPPWGVEHVTLQP